MKFLIFYTNLGFASSLECQAAQPLLFPKGNQGFVKGCGWVKTQNIMIFIRNHDIMKLSGNPWNFINFHDFRVFRKISAPQRWQAKNTVFPMLFQWL